MRLNSSSISDRSRFLGERQPFSVKSASLHEDALIVSPGLCSLTRKPSASMDTTATRIAL